MLDGEVPNVAGMFDVRGDELFFGKLHIANMLINEDATRQMCNVLNMSLDRAIQESVDTTIDRMLNEG